MTPPPPLLFRCAGSAEQGLGHVMRAVALAQAARSAGGRVTFVMPADGVASAIPESYGFPLEPIASDLGPEAEAATIAAGASPDSWVVVDGYALGDRVRLLRRRGLRVCLVDDAPEGMSAGADADLWIRPGLGLRAEAPRALCGPSYAPLRAELRRARLAAVVASRPSQAVRLVILTGGSDVARLLGRVLEVLAWAAGTLPPLEILAVLGPSAPKPPSAEVAALSDRMTIEIVRAPRDLIARLVGSTLAITAAGTTTLELLCLGVPPLMIAAVDNQVGVAARIAGLGAGIDLGAPADLTPRGLVDGIRQVLSDRPSFVRAGQALVDGGGARRVVAALVRASRRARA